MLRALREISMFAQLRIRPSREGLTGAEQGSQQLSVAVMFILLLVSLVRGDQGCFVTRLQTIPYHRRRSFNDFN